MQLLQRLTLDAVAQVRRTCLICDEDWCESCFADSAKQDAIKVRRCGVALVFLLEPLGARPLPVHKQAHESRGCAHGTFGMTGCQPIPSDITSRV
jgi:hypothetical protein